MKTVAVLQSNYLPWKGYFDIIHDVDEFIFYDEVQYTKNDWRNRNYIYTNNGLRWITLPCGTDLHRSIDAVELKNQLPWRAEHWNKISEAYRKAPFFARYREFFEQIYRSDEWVYLSILNKYIITTISREFLGIRTAFTDSRNYAAQGSRNEKLLNLIVASGAQRYISGPAARGYITDEEFAQRGVSVTWKDYGGYPVYRQMHEPFEHGVSIIDLLFNVGEDAPHYIWGWREK